MSSVHDLVQYVRTAAPAALLALSLGCTKPNPPTQTSPNEPVPAAQHTEPNREQSGRQNTDDAVSRANQLEERLEELVPHVEQHNITENIEQFRNALLDMDQTVQHLQNGQLTLRQFLRELRTYEGLRGRYIQALTTLQNKRALPLLFLQLPLPFLQPQSMLQLRGLNYAVPVEFLALARNEPMRVTAVFQDKVGDFEYGFRDDVEGRRREYFYFVQHRKGENRQHILIYANGVLTKQTVMLVPEYHLRPEIVPAIKFMEWSTHPALRQYISCPDEFFEDEAAQRGEILKFEQYFFTTDTQASVAERLFQEIRQTRPVELEFLTQYLNSTSTISRDMTDFTLGRIIGVAPNTQLFRLTEQQNFSVQCESNEITFTYPDYQRSIRFVPGQLRGHIIHTVTINNQPTYACDWYMPTNIVESALRNTREDYNQITIALNAQTQLRQLQPPPPAPQTYRFPNMLAPESARNDIENPIMTENPITEQLLEYYLDLKTVAEYFGDKQQANDITATINVISGLPND